MAGAKHQKPCCNLGAISTEAEDIEQKGKDVQSTSKRTVELVAHSGSLFVEGSGAGECLHARGSSLLGVVRSSGSIAGV